MTYHLIIGFLPQTLKIRRFFCVDGCHFQFSVIIQNVQIRMPVCSYQSRHKIIHKTTKPSKPSYKHVQVLQVMSFLSPDVSILILSHARLRLRIERGHLVAKSTSSRAETTHLVGVTW